MRLTVIGCSGSFPGPDSPASCYLAEAEGFRLLIDLGSGALGPLQRAAGLAGVHAIMISHLHADHCLDLCGYSVARTYHPAGPMPPIPVYGPAGTAQRLSAALRPVPDDMAGPAGSGEDPGHAMTDAFGFETLRPGPVEVGPFRITAARMNHPVETFGLRLEHGGRSVAYSADTGPTDALADLASGADLLVCEASFAQPGPGGPELPPGLHLTGRQAGEHAAKAGAGRLVLTHLPPWNDPSATLAEAARAYRGEVSLAAPGLLLDIG